MLNSFMTLSYRNQSSDLHRIVRGGSRAAAISKMERFVILANGWKLLSQSAPSWMSQQP